MPGLASAVVAHEVDEAACQLILCEGEDDVESSFSQLFVQVDEGDDAEDGIESRDFLTQEGKHRCQGRGLEWGVEPNQEVLPPSFVLFVEAPLRPSCYFQYPSGVCL